MSNRWLAGFIQGGNFNPFATQTTSYTYGIWSWGANINGQLGQNDQGNAAKRSSPTQIGALDGWSNVNAAKSDNTVIAVKNGTLWAWGKNNYGQLGQSDTVYRSSPTQIGASSDWLTVSAGQYFQVAIKTTGTLWAWGRNNVGQLGIGNTTDYSSPKQVGALTTWSKIATGSGHCISIKTDGTLWAWGRNGFGQLGRGNTINLSSPAQVGALTTWLSVACGDNFTIAARTNGTLWAWGINDVGQLGIGNTTYYSSPKQVGALTNWLTPGAAREATFVVKTDGTLWSWGNGGTGQLGIGVSGVNYSSPKQVGALTNWSQASGANFTASATKTNGTLWSWGANGDGELGLNNTTNYSSPKQVGSETSWYLVSRGADGGFAIKY